MINKDGRNNLFSKVESGIEKLEKWSRRVSLPGFSQVPLYNVAIFIYSELKKDDIMTRSNSVAFSFFLSIFPFVIFILPLLTLTPWATEYITQLETEMEGVIPSSVKDYIINVVNGIKTDGSAPLQLVSLFIAAIFASSGMLTLMYGFDKSYKDSFKYRNYFKKRLVAINLTILVALIVFVTVVLQVWSMRILRSVATETFLFDSLRWLVIFFLFYMVITVLYRYGPSTYRPLKFINPGAIVATVFSILASVGFSYFINNFGRYNEIYGSIGALIVTLLWMQINAFIILAGFELNASIIVNRDLTWKKKAQNPT